MAIRLSAPASPLRDRDGGSQALSAFGIGTLRTNVVRILQHVRSGRRGLHAEQVVLNLPAYARLREFRKRETRGSRFRRMVLRTSFLGV